MSRRNDSEALRITALSVYYPESVLSAEDIAERSGLPVDVVTEKFGLRHKHVAGDDEHVSTMSVRAAEPLTASTNLGIEADTPIIYFGSSIKDYDLWSCAVAVQHRLGLTGGFAFEVASNCAGFGVALHVARGLFAADSDLRSMLLIGASKESAVVDYTDLATKSVFAFGDGAAALLLERSGEPGLHVLSTAVISDGTFNTAVLVPAGGTVMPASSETVAGGDHKVRVQPGLRLATEVGPQFVELMTRVGAAAIDKAHLVSADIDVVLLQHQVPSVVKAIVGALGCETVTTVDLADFGHMSSLDLPTALYLALERGLIGPGGTALLLSAGLGYTWAGSVVRRSGQVTTFGPAAN